MKTVPPSTDPRTFDVALGTIVHLWTMVIDGNGSVTTTIHGSGADALVALYCYLLDHGAKDLPDDDTLIDWATGPGGITLHLADHAVWFGECRYCHTRLGGRVLAHDEEPGDECGSCNELKCDSFEAGFNAGRESR